MDSTLSTAPANGLSSTAESALSSSSVTTALTNTTSVLTWPSNQGFGWRLIHLTVKLGYSVVVILFILVAPPGLETPDKNPKPFQNPGQMSGSLQYVSKHLSVVGPFHLDMAYEDVWINTKDGCKLHAWLIKQKSPLDYTTLPTLIFFQGNAGSEDVSTWVPDGLSSYLLFGLLRYGYSTGTPSENGVYIDAEAALDFLLSRKDIDGSKIMVFGRSIGGAVAIDLAFKRSGHLRGIIVENTFTSLHEMAKIVFPFLKMFSSLVPIAQRLFMDSLSKVPSLQIPIIYISGLKDALVPPAHVRRLYSATTSSPLRLLYPIANGTHNDTWQQAGMEYYLAISDFVNRALQLPSQTQTLLAYSTLQNETPVPQQRPSQLTRDEL